MKTTLMLATMLTAATAFAQVMIPDGTKVRVRLEQNLSSETAELGQTIDFAVTQEVRVGDGVVVANGARATGSITAVQQRRGFGRAGRLDFTIERVQLVDGAWLSVRYTPQKNKGKGNGAAAGLVTGGLAVVFLPAALGGGLVKGHDATIIKGRTYDVFSDESVYVANAAAANTPMVARVLPQAPAMPVRQANGEPMNNGGLQAALNTPANPVLVSNASVTAAVEVSATVSITSNTAGAEIEVDGMFVGSTPTTIQLTPGVHNISVHADGAAWEREMQITAGTVNVAANLAAPAVRLAKK